MLVLLYFLWLCWLYCIPHHLLVIMTFKFYFCLPRLLCFPTRCSNLHFFFYCIKLNSVHHNQIVSFFDRCYLFKKINSVSCWESEWWIPLFFPPHCFPLYLFQWKSFTVLIEDFKISSNSIFRFGRKDFLNFSQMRMVIVNFGSLASGNDLNGVGTTVQKTRGNHCTEFAFPSAWVWAWEEILNCSWLAGLWASSGIVTTA